MATKVVVESPFAFKHPDPAESFLGLLRHITYAQLAMHDCIERGEEPYASHLLLTQRFILDDDMPEQRKLGIDTGLSWGKYADISALYLDMGVSSGMKYGIQRANEAGRPIEMRNLPGWETALNESPRETLLRLELYTEDQLELLLFVNNTVPNLPFLLLNKAGPQALPAEIFSRVAR